MKEVVLLIFNLVLVITVSINGLILLVEGKTFEALVLIMLAIIFLRVSKED